MSRTFQDCWFLTGATAVGKTGVGLALAKRLGAEIISLDSMAIYRGMDIGTAKPSAAERAVVPHHLIDISDPTEEYSVAQYLAAAKTTIRDLRARGKEALFVGGTPLYLKALLRGLFDGPPADWQIRHDIEQELAATGQRALHDRLMQVDPVAATAIHPHDTRRLIRALEVYRATGEPISHQQMQFEEGRPAEECRVFVLRRRREELHRLIEARVEAMIELGLVDEVRRLVATGGSPVSAIAGEPPAATFGRLGRTARQAVGYREALGFLVGEFDRPEMVERIKVRTRRFAKRQGTWFRSLSECRFIELTGDVDINAVTNHIARQGALLRNTR